MGYGLPAAIAAGLVHRDRAVVALVGDGGLGMTLAEIETAVRMGLKTIVLVFDNQRYGMIRTYQDRRPVHVDDSWLHTRCLHRLKQQRDHAPARGQQLLGFDQHRRVVWHGSRPAHVGQ
jgi:TPP-dependent trihydroxycyclohexane-1,2-dione (THcHDO) dehydratase